MKQPRIIVHCLVANEERFIWYSLNSVLPFVTKIMVWDTGSSDNTIKIINRINSTKIELREMGSVDAMGHTRARERMLRQTDMSQFDWLLILDGDEVWRPDMFQKMLGEAKEKEPDAVVVRTVNFVGDIYHKEPEIAGHYRFANRVGHYNLRLINLRLPSLHVRGRHGQQGYYSGESLLQELPVGKLLILDNVYYFHATHLDRSPFDKNTTKRSFKKKFDIGEVVSREDLPKIFFEHIEDVPDVTKRYRFGFWVRAIFEKVPRRIKYLLLPHKEGY